MSEKTVSFLEKIFGENWRTTVWGGITGLAVAIAAYPDSVAFLPDDIEGYVKGIAAFISLYTGGKFLSKTADVKQVEKVKASVQSTKKQIKDLKDDAA